MDSGSETLLFILSFIAIIIAVAVIRLIIVFLLKLLAKLFKPPIPLETIERVNNDAEKVNEIIQKEQNSLNNIHETHHIQGCFCPECNTMNPNSSDRCIKCGCDLKDRS